jgi:hypothetical protein
MPYQFYARIGSNEPIVVNIVMPVGGKETGFYRYPKAGEEILVDSVGSESYLMGYIPSVTDAANSFLTNVKEDESTEAFDGERAALENEEGMILRYQQTGKKAPSSEDVTDRYSEIGFYHRQTQWPSTDSQYKGVPPKRNAGELDSVYSARLVTAGFPKNTNESGKFDTSMRSDELIKSGKPKESDAAHIARVTAPTVFPAIDQINIQSTGDIHTTAQNYQKFKAKRFELLVDAEEDVLPLGDNQGDDSVLHAGDAHIRAGNRVVIKAGDEIILQVGKTVLKISDGELNVISKLINSNVTNAYDATLSMSGEDGVSLAGLSVDISAINDFSIGDTLGGGIESELGIVSIGGREIKSEVYDSAQFKTLVIGALQQYGLSVKAGVEGIRSAKSGKEDKKEDESEDGNKIVVFGKKAANWVSDNNIVEYVKDSVKILKKSYGLFNKITGLRKQYKDLAEKATLEAEQTADEDRDTAIAKAEKEREDAKRKADLDKAMGKITEEEANERKADADAKADKAIVDAYAKEVKTLTDADAVREKQKARKEAEEAKKAADEYVEKTKKQADEDAAAAKKQAEDDLLAGTKKTEDQVKEAKKQADEKAKETKKQAEKEAKEAKKQADKDLKAQEKEADAEAKKSRDEVDERAKKEKEQVDKDAKNKKTPPSSGGGSGSNR